MRNPFSWYESWWRYQEERGWPEWPNRDVCPWHPNEALNGLGSNSFNQFMYKVVNERPGYVTEMFYS